MRKVLQDPIAVKKKEDGIYPFEFKAPSYDNRSSSAMRAGDDYGIGHRTPIGKFSPGPMKSGPIPQEADCFEPKEIFYGGEDRKG